MTYNLTNFTKGTNGDRAILKKGNESVTVHCSPQSRMARIQSIHASRRSWWSRLGGRYQLVSGSPPAPGIPTQCHPGSNTVQAVPGASGDKDQGRVEDRQELVPGPRNPQIAAVPGSSIKRGSWTECPLLATGITTFIPGQGFPARYKHVQYSSGWTSANDRIQAGKIVYDPSDVQVGR